MEVVMPGLRDLWAELDREDKAIVRILVKRGWRGVRAAIEYAIETR